MVAPTTAQYLVLATDAGLSAERKLVFGEGFGVNDGGANADYSVSVMSRVLDRVVTSLTCTGTVSTTMYSIILNPNELSTNAAVELIFIGGVTNNNAAGNSLSLAIQLGGTVLFKDAYNINDSGTSARRAIYMKLFLAAENATNAQILTGGIWIGDSVSAAVGLGNFHTDEIGASTPIRGASAENGTTSLTFAMWVRWSSVAGGFAFWRRMAYLIRL